MKTQELKITVPDGYEIDNTKSTFENIVFKEIEITAKPTAEELLMSIFLQCTPKKITCGIGWFIGDQWIFEQNWKNQRLYCYYYKVWSVFETEYSLNYGKIKQLQRDVVGKVLNCEGLTPPNNERHTVSKVGKVLNCEGLTPSQYAFIKSIRWERY